MKTFDFPTYIGMMGKSSNPAYDRETLELFSNLLERFEINYTPKFIRQGDVILQLESGLLQWPLTGLCGSVARIENLDLLRNPQKYMADWHKNWSLDSFCEKHNLLQTFTEGVLQYTDGVIRTCPTFDLQLASLPKSRRDTVKNDMKHCPVILHDGMSDNVSDILIRQIIDTKTSHKSKSWNKTLALFGLAAVKTGRGLLYWAHCKEGNAWLLFVKSPEFSTLEFAAIVQPKDFRNFGTVALLRSAVSAYARGYTFVDPGAVTHPEELDSSYIIYKRKACNSEINRYCYRLGNLTWDKT